MPSDVLKFECKYSFDKDDAGGETYIGICRKYYTTISILCSLDKMKLIGLKFDVDYQSIIQTKTITNEINKYKKKYFTLVVQTGFGYGIINRNPYLYIEMWSLI